VSEQDLKEVKRADHAKRLLENPVYEEAWEAIRARLLLLMETAQTDEATLKAKLALGLLNDLRQHWTRIIGDGAIAAQSIELEKHKKKWFSRAA
jgi:hypothetical protein